MPSFKQYFYNLLTYKINGLFASFLRGVLFLFSLPYGLVVVILAFFYRIKSVRFQAKVISVGNITLGGTGKTPLVEYLSAKVACAGHKVAILTRGYKRNLRDPALQNLGDVPAMLAKNLPQVKVIVGKNRIKAAQTALNGYGADTLILDDGMQQWKIAKDLEIATINAADPFGNCRLLPAGFLREPLNALKRADIFVLTHLSSSRDPVELYARLRGLNPRALIVEADHKAESFSSIIDPQEVFDLNYFKEKVAVVFSGIGSPEGFEKNIRDLKVRIAKSIRFMDHHDYLQSEIDEIIKIARQMQADIIMTTQKDAVKVSRLKIRGAQIISLNIKLDIIKNEAEFNRRLLKLYSF